MVGLAVRLIVRDQHVIHCFDVERRVPEDHEKGPAEARVFARFDDLLNQARNSLELFRRCVVGHAECKSAPAFLPNLEIPDPATKKITVGKHELFSGHGSDSRTLEADVLHRPLQIPNLNVIADREWFVEDDRKGGEEIPKHTLKGQGQSDTADSQGGDQRPDVDIQVVEGEHGEGGPYREPHEEADGAEGRGDRRVGLEFLPGPASEHIVDDPLAHNAP